MASENECSWLQNVENFVFSAEKFAQMKYF